ncbi:hypothetical protein [Hyphobacterium marinum]|uniref:Imelysin-like domain-containing protein n=1 Tax=Hyphobacterium marinum TaxID=3116574 RepID=A0ABU7M174_9PROT|nr:hypothetical protein [Hyphobacterium sp. Y6023]MEE2567015.1 hypothetical protein [Hyphobacterium sp. Y6023]
MLVGLIAVAQLFNCSDFSTDQIAHPGQLAAARDALAEHYGAANGPETRNADCLARAAYDSARTDLERAAALQVRMQVAIRLDDWLTLAGIVEEGLALTAGSSPEAAALRQQFHTGASFLARATGDESLARRAADEALHASALAEPDSWDIYEHAYLHRATGLVCASTGTARLVSLESPFPHHVRCDYRMDDRVHLRTEALVDSDSNPDAEDNLLSWRLTGEATDGPYTAQIGGLPVRFRTYPDFYPNAPVSVRSGRAGATVFAIIAEPETPPDDTTQSAISDFARHLVEGLIAGHTPAGPDPDVHAFALQAAHDRYRDALRGVSPGLALRQASGFARVAAETAPDADGRLAAEQIAADIAAFTERESGQGEGLPPRD